MTSTLATQILSPRPSFDSALRRLERVDVRNLRSIAKIVGTAICLAGAMFMAFFKGPKLLGAILLSATSDWVKGGIYLIGNAVCFSIWYIIQVLFFYFQSLLGYLIAVCSDAANRFNKLILGLGD